MNSTTLMLEEEENPKVKGLEIEHKICDTSRMKKLTTTTYSTTIL